MHGINLLKIGKDHIKPESVHLMTTVPLRFVRPY